ncbi:MAG: dihydrofolate reductase [Colwellia sp.]|nr:dihydrofolate reductase [Colwellia sp.]
MTIKMILATGRNGELGGDNKLLWHVPEDLKSFKALTEGTVCVTGRATHESIKAMTGCTQGLPNRINVVATRQVSRITTGLNKRRVGKVNLDYSKDTLIDFYKSSGLDISVCGGAEIYKEFLDVTDEIYHTLVDAEYPDADCHFDMSFLEDETTWEKVSTKCLTSEAKVMHYVRRK